MDLLRHFQHAQLFQLLVRDLEDALLLETLSDHLTELADLVLDTALSLAWSGLKQKHHDTPAFAIIGYGKLGGKELGYVSDLDIVFLYNDDDPNAAEIYTKLGQSINAWLTPRPRLGHCMKPTCAYVPMVPVTYWYTLWKPLHNTNTNKHGYGNIKH